MFDGRGFRYLVKGHWIPQFDASLICVCLVCDDGLMPGVHSGNERVGRLLALEFKCSVFVNHVSYFVPISSR